LFRFGFRESAYTTLLMSTGLTFGTISALFGLTHGYIDPAGTYRTSINQEQYSILVTVVIGSAIVPTLIAQRFFRPEIEPVVALEVGPRAHGGLVPGTDGVIGAESRRGQQNAEGAMVAEAGRDDSRDQACLATQRKHWIATILVSCWPPETCQGEARESSTADWKRAGPARICN
jgi:hypothetical protein